MSVKFIHQTARRLGAQHAVALMLIALPLVFFHRLAFTGMILARGDVYAYFYPYWQARSAALLGGSPLWTPDIFMGVPLLANSQVGLFYPPNWPLVPFDAPTGVAISLLFHAVWALLGAYRLGRDGLRLERVPALLAAALFGLGGALGAKVENVNQFQALAWLPWLFWLFDRAAVGGLRRILLLAAGLALQTLAGHPQTVFISLVGLAIYGLFAGDRRGVSWRQRLIAAVRPLAALLAAGLVALALAAAQLVPTLELMSASNRSGGLNPQQAMAFSLNPFVIGRGLLPSYDGLLFGEYVAYVGVIGLGLALVGALAGRGGRLPWVILAAAGIALALGLYNPLYWPLATLPGFSFFRVPARWLALYGLAAAMLAGLGLQALGGMRRVPAWLPALIVLATGGLGAASLLTDRMAVDVIGPAVPTEKTFIGWGLALGALLLALVSRGRWARLAVPGVTLLGAAALVELFLAARVLAYNEVVPPDTYSAQRFSISQMRAYADQQTPPGRVLSISQLLFDPGDMDSLTARYRQAGMSDLAIRIALVAVKMRETLAANLPLTWGIPSVDGFDGGVLPTGWYTQFTALMLPPDALRTVDGRLREILARESCRGACIPDRRWLNLTNTRYLITDKIHDLWRDDVAYDTQFAADLPLGGQQTIRHVPAFEADAADVLYTCPDAPCAPPAVIFTGEDGRAQTLLVSQQAELDGFRWARLAVGSAAAPVSVALQAAGAPVTVHAITLVDTRAGVFQQLALGPWRRALSSDIKLYENLDALPRAFVVYQTAAVAESWQGGEDALAIMRDPAFDPAQTVVIAEQPAPVETRSDAPPRAAIITAYTAQRVEIVVEAGAAGWLVLSDAYYPGWTATVNDQPAPVYRANVMFRAVPLPAGQSVVSLEFRPGWWPWLPIIGGAAWLLVIALLAGYGWTMGTLSRLPSTTRR